MLLGHQQPRQAHVDKALPDRGVAIVAFVEAAQHFGAVRPGQIVANGFGQFEAFGIDQEVHRASPQPLPTRGMPSSRSAVMLRWISLDPA